MKHHIKPTTESSVTGLSFIPSEIWKYKYFLTIYQRSSMFKQHLTGKSEVLLCELGSASIVSVVVPIRYLSALTDVSEPITCYVYLWALENDSFFRMKICQNKVDCVVLDHIFWKPSVLRLSHVNKEAEKGWESWESIHKPAWDLPSRTAFSGLARLFSTNSEDWWQLRNKIWRLKTVSTGT